MRGNRRNANSGSDKVMGIIDDNGFTLKTFNPKRKFTETSAAAQYCMKTDPYFLRGTAAC